VVSSLEIGTLDPVAKRLVAAGEEQAAGVLEWLDSQQHRIAMRRRAVWCTAGGWLLMTTAAIVSSVVAISMSGDALEAFEMIRSDSDVPPSVIIAPFMLAAIAIMLIVGGIFVWTVEKIPVFSKTASAIDWSSTSEAVTRLLSAGCTYPEAFRTAAQVARSTPSRVWLTEAAERVERGGGDVATSTYARGDAAVLELMIDAAGAEPQRQWQVAADHFLELASRRLVLLLQSTPMIATIVSGLLIWISISTTLGWLWTAVAQMIRGLGG
jgi:hypothetical protein